MFILSDGRAFDRLPSGFLTGRSVGRKRAPYKPVIRPGLFNEYCGLRSYERPNGSTYEWLVSRVGSHVNIEMGLLSKALDAMGKSACVLALLSGSSGLSFK